MALPASIDPTKPLGTDQKKDGDDQIRALKQFIVDILGLPVEPTNMTAAIMDANADGTIASSLSIALKNAANVFTADQKVENTSNPSWELKNGVFLWRVMLGGDNKLRIQRNTGTDFDTSAEFRFDTNDPMRLEAGTVPLARMSHSVSFSVSLGSGSKDTRTIIHSLGTDDVFVLLSAKNDKANSDYQWSCLMTKPDGTLTAFSGRGDIISARVAAVPASGAVVFETINRASTTQTITVKAAIFG